jgi:hypothetical protein
MAHAEHPLSCLSAAYRPVEDQFRIGAPDHEVAEPGIGRLEPDTIVALLSARRVTPRRPIGCSSLSCRSNPPIAALSSARL